MQEIWYALLYLFEMAADYIFFENLYYRKEEPDYSRYRLLAYPITAALSYIVSFLQIPFLNVIVFLATTFFIAYFCYATKIRSCIFSSLMLTTFMLATETIVLLLSSAILKTGIHTYNDDMLMLVSQSSLSKLLLLTIIFITAKVIFNKEAHQKSDKFLIALAILPFSTIAVLLLLVNFKATHEVEEPYTTTLTVCAVLLLFSNVIVFYIYDLVQRTNLTVIQLRLEQQKEKTNIEYYKLLMHEHENQKVLIHDIKRHLRIIEKAAADGNCQNVTDYIDSIRDRFGLDEKIKYSGNKLIDVIINRYVLLCKKNEISIEVETLCADLDFMKAADLTALLDNMFENAVESAIKSQKRELFFSLTRRNDNFAVINLSNSCDIKPTVKDGILKSSKPGKGHGIGTKSMKKIVKQYEGTLEFTWHEEEKHFECEAVLKMK